jgi:hypothetical protein
MWTKKFKTNLKKIKLNIKNQWLNYSLRKTNPYFRIQGLKETK